MHNNQIYDNRKVFFKRFVAKMLCLIVFFGTIVARENCPDQGPRLSAEEYCRLYAAEAQRQMSRYGIPASITLAQGMFESGYASSFLAVIGNNHFGIKSYRDWTGPTISCDDDKKSEPFCKFASVADGFEHHSKFLKNSARYAELFQLSPHDYKGWAKGLKRCGYATDSRYPDKLIELIERYGLDRYDRGEAQTISSPEANKVTISASQKPKSQNSASTKPQQSGANSKPSSQQNSANAKPQPKGTTSKPAASQPSNSAMASTRHKLYSTSTQGGLKYVKANKTDYLVIIAREFGISERKLRKYNEMGKYYKLTEGEIVYLESKRTHADKMYPEHIVQPGESLHSIAQKYGVTVSSIAKRNNLKSGAVQVGQCLRLR